MRGISRTFAATVLALGTGIAVAAPALATEEEYLSDLRADDWLGGDAQLLNWGYRACTDLNNGIFRGTIVHNVWEGTDESITMDDANFLVASAEMYLC